MNIRESIEMIEETFGRTVIQCLENWIKRSCNSVTPLKKKKKKKKKRRMMVSAIWPLSRGTGVSNASRTFVSSMFMPCRLLASNRIYPVVSVHRLPYSRHLTRLSTSDFSEGKYRRPFSVPTHAVRQSMPTRKDARRCWPGWRGALASPR